MYQGTGSGDCSFVFETGRRYLLYAYYSAETKQFHTNICTRSAAIEYAAEDLWYLRGLPASNEGNNLTGLIVNYDYVEDGIPSIPDLIANVKVIATADGKRFEAVTNNEGFYKMLNLQDVPCSAWTPWRCRTLRNDVTRLEMEDVGIY
jgi:phosphatidate phosphatase APP1